MSLVEENPKKKNTEKTVKKTRKKKVELKPNQYDMGNGFLLEIVTHPVGDEYGKLEGFLSYQGSDLEIADRRFYESNSDVITDFSKRIIPEFANGFNIKVFKYLDNELMFNFTRNYLEKNKDKITYGKVLDIIHILEEDGYEIPKWNDKAQVNNLLDFYHCVDRLSLEFKTHLRIYGFTADRNLNNTTDHPEFTKNPNCRNIVFTRYPWSNGFKAISAINDFLTFTNNDLSTEIDMKTFKKFSSEAHNHLAEILSTFNKVNLKTKQSLEDISYNEIKDGFKAYFKANKSELLSIWSKKRPKNYGVYPMA